MTASQGSETPENLLSPRTYSVEFQLGDALEIEAYAKALELTTPEVIRELVKYGLRSRKFKDLARAKRGTMLKSPTKPRQPKP